MRSLVVSVCILLGLGLVAGFVLVTTHPETMPHFLQKRMDDSIQEWLKQREVLVKRLQEERSNTRNKEMIEELERRIKQGDEQFR